MHRPNQCYSGKKTAYLDHNILNYFIRYPKITAFKEIFAEHQIVYSDETLREIKRGNEGHEARLNVLKSLDAMHLKLLTNESFEITEDAILSEADVHIEFKRINQESELNEKINSSTQRILQKFYGNNGLASIRQLSDQQSKEFRETLQTLLDDLSSSETPNELANNSIQYITRTLTQHAELLRHSTNMMLRYQEDSNKPIVSSYREKVGIGPLQLNNLKEPNIIAKIWKLHETLDGYKGHNFTIEDFLGSSLIPANLDGLVPTYSKILQAYNVLNVVGYCNDSNMKQERRFIASMSDANHVAMASFADFLYSSDIFLIKKAKAIYEHLEVPTKACEFKVTVVPADR